MTVTPSPRASGAYRWFALAAVAVALLGFARTYYLRELFGRGALPLTLHAHGLIMSAWLAVFTVQTWLIARGRRSWHRRLGVAAAVLAVLVIVTGAVVTVLAVEREARAHVVGMFHYLLLINFVNLLLFGAFVGCGLLARARPEIHKRFMLLATVVLVAPAVARITLLFTHAAWAQFAAFYLWIVACVLLDTWRNRRLHPTLAWGALAAIAGFQLSDLAVQTPQWLSLVRAMFWS